MIYRYGVKMAVEVKVSRTLNLIVSPVEGSGNTKKELKQVVFETIISVRDLFVKLKGIRNRESH
jgi:hypothetical protein